MNPHIPTFEGLSFSEKLQLVEDLWDSLASDPETLPIPQWQRDELARRRASYEANPENVLTWEEAKQRIRRSPERFEAVQGDFRRAIVRRFPYVIFFKVSGESIVVHAIFHSAQDPRKWRKRLTQ